ncbi:MAG: hypothetical protein E3J46_12240, partial [Desulfobacteraceae bacterium]
MEHPICDPKLSVKKSTHDPSKFSLRVKRRFDPLIARMIRRHEKNILSYFKLPINNASVEGLNNKPKIISRRAYGFRSVRSHIL